LASTLGYNIGGLITNVKGFSVPVPEKNKKPLKLTREQNKGGGILNNTRANEWSAARQHFILSLQNFLIVPIVVRFKSLPFVSGD
jgi:hypothetical protein